MSAFTSKEIAKGITEKRTALFTFMLLATCVFILPLFQLKIDTSGVSFPPDESEVYKTYMDFVNTFGTDDYILLVVKNDLPLADPELKKRMRKVHDALSATPFIHQVISLETISSSSLSRFHENTGRLTEEHLARLRRTLPGIKRLVSDDMTHLGFIVKIDNDILNGFRLEKELNRIRQMMADTFPEHPHCYAAGIPVLRSAFERYNLKNAIMFGALGIVFGTLIAFYLFRTLWAVVLVLASSCASLIWICGIMGLFKINLNLATGLSFGFIPVIATTTVFHLLTAYFQSLLHQTSDKAFIKAIQEIIYPSFMCALTTAMGFLSLAISPVPMISQAGLVISISVMVTYVISLLTSTYCIPGNKRFQNAAWLQKREDLPEKMAKTWLFEGFNRPVVCVWAGIIFILATAAGISGIQRVKHLTNPFIQSTREAKDIEYIGRHLYTGTSFSIILDPGDNGLNRRDLWYNLIELEKNIQSLPGVQGVDSLTRLVFAMALKFSAGGIQPEKAFRQIKKIQGDMLQSYFDPVSGKLRLIVHIHSNSSEQIEKTLEMVKRLAETIIGSKAGIKSSGQLILLRAQTQNIVSSEVKTLLWALAAITILMMIQLKSVTMGLLGLIPNLFPLVSIFGIMGWFNIPLDPLTIFAAVISFGLSVDDSIHYLTRLKQEIQTAKPDTTIYQCLKTAYRKTARALISTTAVFFLSASALLLSPFTHVFSLGVLLLSASVIALIADLVFLPAAALTITPLNKLLSLKLKKTADETPLY